MSSNPKDETEATAEVTSTAPTQAQINEALQGTDTGSDTRAGSLRGGSASGSEIDPDQERVNADLARKGQAMSDEATRPAGGPDEAAKPDRQAGDDADAPTS